MKKIPENALRDSIFIDSKDYFENLTDIFLSEALSASESFSIYSSKFASVSFSSKYLCSNACFS